MLSVNKKKKKIGEAISIKKKKGREAILKSSRESKKWYKKVRIYI